MLIKLLKWLGAILVFLVVVEMLKHYGVIDKLTNGYVADSGNTDGRNNAATLKLSNQELAAHAVNNYDYDCDTVVSRGKMQPAGFYSITCGNGKILRVYPKGYEYPEIRNKSGGSQ